VFEHLGLTTEAENVYRAMLARRSWEVAEIAAYLELSECEVHAALDQLADLALVAPSWSAPGELRPVQPSVGLVALLTSAENDMIQRRQQIEATRAAIAAIAEEQENIRGHEVVNRLDGSDAVRGRLEEMATNVRRECLSFNPGAAHSPDAMDASRPLNQKALERGVAIRCVYQDSFRNDANTLAYARWLTALGGQTRTTPTLPMQLIIIDREVALVPLDPADPRVGAVEVRNPGVVAAICALFEQVWLTALPFGEAAMRDRRGLDAQERELLRLLADGHTDESAGRKLGLSVRTVRRMMAELTDRLGATSRFQAGAYAVQRGWL
jgi:DNA-binding CsgD family transcriptional regulator/sugar-specific transcriptional regulator TrmB